MKKILTAIAVLMISLSLTGCFGLHKITVTSGKEEMVKCPRFAKTGETVSFETVIVCDADLYVNANVDVRMISEGVYEFTMPDYDVEIRITVKSNGLA